MIFVTRRGSVHENVCFRPSIKSHVRFSIVNYVCAAYKHDASHSLVQSRSVVNGYTQNSLTNRNVK